MAPNTLEIQVITPWLPLLRPDGTEDRESHPLAPSDPQRHQLLREMALRLMDECYPWLRPILVAANAQVLASWGWFAIATPTNETEIPELSACLQLMPWAEDWETPQ